ncbi:MAG: sulfatase-like hydrolase/transferase [Phycisphaerales bacterium]|nr:MAG: sulfatase-like hydrolase/transferase [Phycisphaerales bacterium]
MRFRTYTTVSFVILALAVLLIAGVAIWHHYAPRTNEIRNVLLISIDTCRADHLGCYGYPLDTTPNIDAIAGEGIVFEYAISPLPYTLPGHCSMLTGTIPPYHGVFDNSDYKLSDGDVTLAELLKAKGYVTAGFVSSFILDSRFGLGQGFDFYDDDFEEASNAMDINQQSGGETTHDVIEWLRTHKDEKNFIFLHYYDPHFTYEPPEPFASRFRNVPPPEHVKTKFEQALFDGYAGEIAYTDHCIGQVIDKLRELGLYDSTMIIITSDHGEMLGQHGEGFHGYFVYQPALRVPLIFKLPRLSKHKRITSTVGLVDIVPTVCSVLGIDLSSPIQGQDLSPCFDSDWLPPSDRHLFCQSLEPTKYNANSLLGVVTDRYKYIKTTRSELYDLVEDPDELDNIAVEQADQSQKMEEKLRQILQETTRDKEDGKEHLDDQTRERLESLGYIGGSVNDDLNFDQGGEDPKDLIEYHVRMMRIGFLIYKQRYDFAESECRQLISERPSFHGPYFNLAKMAVRQGNYAEAVTNFERVIELRPDIVYSYEGLGVAYEAQGQFDKAVLSYVKVMELRPDYVKAYHQMALCFYELGEFREPDKYATAVLKNNPSYVDAAISLADKLLERRQIRLAYEHYLRILELRDDSVTVLNALAWIEAACDIEQLRNPEQAVERALLACEMTNFATAEVVDTLAVAYAAAGKFREAIETANKAMRAAESAGNAALAQRIKNRLDLYKAEKPFRDASLTDDASQ